MPPTLSAKEAAQAFVRSYADAMELSKQPDTTVDACAKALNSHYNPSKTVAFSKGHVVLSDGSPDFWLNGIITHLKRFDKAGLGWKIHMKTSRVEVLSDSAAACFVTWEIEPASGNGWSWENIYGWRGSEEGNEKGWWEYIVSDNEVDELLKRVPGFWELEV